MLECWDAEPTRRPTFNLIHRQFLAMGAGHYFEPLSVEVVRTNSDLIFPEEFTGKVPVQVATPRLLSYFGATIKKGGPSSPATGYHVSEHSHSGKKVLPKEEGGEGKTPSVRDGEYSEEFCPMDRDSGTFVLLKFKYLHDDDKKTRVHISGFRIPIGHTLKIPANSTFFTDDYLKGLWTTYSSNYDPLYPRDYKLKKGTIEKHRLFHFTFA